MENKYKTWFIVAIIFSIITLVMLWFFGIIEFGNPPETINLHIYREFNDGQYQSFDIEKVSDDEDISFNGRVDCEKEFLKRNPSFVENNIDEEETYYCIASYTHFFGSYDITNSGGESSGRQTCQCYYK